MTKSRSVAETDMVSEIADGVCQIIQVLIAGINAEVRWSTARDNWTVSDIWEKSSVAERILKP